jgi:hypothetical protein
VKHARLINSKKKSPLVGGKILLHNITDEPVTIKAGQHVAELLAGTSSCAEVSEDREVDDILRKLYPEWDEEESERKVTDSAMAITIEGKTLQWL